VPTAVRGPVGHLGGRLADRLLLGLLLFWCCLVVWRLVLPGLEVEDSSHPWWAKAFWLLAYVGLAGAGLAAARRPGRPLVPLLLVAVTWDASGWADAASVPTSLRLVALAAALLLPAALLDLGLRWSSPEGTGFVGARALLYAVAALAAAGRLLVYDPFDDARCRLTCVRVALPWSGDPTTTRVAATLSGLVLVASVVTAVAVLVRSTWHDATAWPDASRLVLAVAVVAEVVIGVAAVASLVLPPIDAQRRWGALFLGRAASLLFLGGTLVFAAWRSRQASVAVARLAEGLSAPDRLEASLARALRDPGLRVLFWYPDERRWVDTTGTEAADVTTGRVTTLTRDGVVVARVVHGRGSAAPDFGRRLSAATLLAIDNARLAVVARARLDDIRLSRQRIVARGDAERQRLERDLHDGAQQQLVSVTLFLRMARDRSPSPHHSGALGDAEERARNIVGDLREIAHGVFPAVLSDEGIAAAVLARVESSAVPVEITRLPGVRYHQAVEMAAYAVIEDALAGMATEACAPVQLSVDEGDGDLRVHIECTATTYDDLRAALTDVEDRVGALGGSLSVIDAGTSIHVEAVIPVPDS
jgi:signal transduction histidine kinase